MPTTPTEARATPGRKALALLAILGVTALAPVIGGSATAASVRSWYPALAKPEWTPPAWVFGPVWTALYLAMGVAAWRVWLWARAAADVRERAWGRGALSLYILQLALNAAWSVLFFGLRSPAAGLAEILVLWAAVLATTLGFFRASRLAGGLMVAYLLWVTFAAALNLAIWRLNRG